MKINFFQALNFFLFIVVLTSIVQPSMAQTAAKPAFVLAPDTTYRANAVEPFAVEVTADANSQKFILSINNPMGERLRITLSGSGATGFGDQTKALKYRKRIDMSEAPDGHYTLVVTSNKRTFTKDITLRTTTIVNRDVTLN